MNSAGFPSILYLLEKLVLFILSKVLVLNLKEQCCIYVILQSACGAKIHIHRTLMNRPEIVSIGIVWDSERPTVDHITDVFRTIGTTLRLQDVSISSFISFLHNFLKAGTHL